jgi:uncharacterized protein (TIGR00159 family)
MKMSGAFNLFLGVLSFMALWLIITQLLALPLIGSILDKLVGVGTIALVILFQDEIRRILVTIGSQRRWKSFSRIFTIRNEQRKDKPDVSAIILACLNMSRTKTGALIIIEEKMRLDSYMQTGEKINADIKTRLIENIFFKNSPLHDGAMIIANGRIDSAGCVLPISYSLDIPKELGLRHRAALGISQETDAKAIIVSEETGKISTACLGELQLDLTPESLKNFLYELRVES